MSEPPQLGHGGVAGAADRLWRSATLVADIASVFAATSFDPADPGLAEVLSAGSHVVLRTDTLAVPMQREISWWMATCHANGERVINTSDWKRWAATAAEVVRRRPEVCSFADLSFAEWMTAWARVFHGDHGRFAATATRRRAENALRGLLPRLAIHYSDLPWWNHDLWCLRFDPRIPRRDHEPHGHASIRWDNIEPLWLREGVQVLPAPEAGVRAADLVLGDALARVRRPLRRVRPSRHLEHPALVNDPAQLRALMLEFRAFLRQWRRATTGRAKYSGGPLDARSVASTLRLLGNFYGR